jgi:hypothetical protein
MKKPASTQAPSHADSLGWFGLMKVQNSHLDDEVILIPLKKNAR